jgi:hypothetical protein
MEEDSIIHRDLAVVVSNTSMEVSGEVNDADGHELRLREKIVNTISANTKFRSPSFTGNVNLVCKEVNDFVLKNAKWGCPYHAIVHTSASPHTMAMSCSDYGEIDGDVSGGVFTPLIMMSRLGYRIEMTLSDPDDKTVAYMKVYVTIHFVTPTLVTGAIKE